MAFMAPSAGAMLGAAATGAGVNLLGAQGGNTDSSSFGAGLGLNSGQSWESGSGSSWQTGGSESESYSHVYGREASAEDIIRAQEANTLNEKWMDKNLAFQEYMSNTAYQRAVKDLLSAGLNPVLAAIGNGASTPMGAMVQAAKATTYPEQESYSSSSSWSEGGGENSYSGGSTQNGINFNFNTGESHSKNNSLIERVAEKAVEGVANQYRGQNGKSYYDHFDVPLNY